MNLKNIIFFTLIAFNFNSKSFPGDGNFNIKHSPLIEAILNNNFNEIKKLISENVDLNQRSAFGYTPLNAAIRMKNFELIKFLIDKQIETNNALYYAITNNNEDIIEFLLTLNVNINGNNPLHLIIKKMLCCQSSWFKVYFSFFKLLIENGADINLQDKNGNTVLHLIIKQILLFDQKDYCDEDNLSKYFIFLLNEKPNTYIKDNSGKSVMDIMKENKKLKNYLKKLINHKNEVIEFIDNATEKTQLFDHINMNSIISEYLSYNEDKKEEYNGKFKCNIM